MYTIVSECWIWRGSIANNYPVYEGKRAKAVIWELYLNEPAPGNIKNTCNNNLCVNPEHLLPGRNRKLSQQDLEEIKEEIKKPYHGQTRYLAEKYGVDPGRISRLRRAGND